jgi:hypothetical protein
VGEEEDRKGETEGEDVVERTLLFRDSPFRRDIGADCSRCLLHLPMSSTTPPVLLCLPDSPSPIIYATLDCYDRDGSWAPLDIDPLRPLSLSDLGRVERS